MFFLPASTGKAVVTSCPWCEEMLRKGAAAKGSNVKVENIFTLLEQSL
jgi:Fe-S oxidoreductase